MKTPLEAVLLILSYEQLRLQVYRDAVGLETWGWGHRLLPTDGLRLGNFVTRERANAQFVVDLERIEGEVLRRLVGADVHLLDHLKPLCFGALVSLGFNVGADGLGEGLLAAVRDEPAAVPGWIKKYNKAGGKVLPGLVERRAAEAKMWERGMSA